MYNTINPAYARSYYGLTNKKINRKEEEEKSSQSSKQAENNLQEQRKNSNANSYFPNGEKVSIDYTKNKISIEQVLKDFKNTTNAIGAPAEIQAEVSQYLSLIENQALKDTPNAQVIQSNLKNASQILDEYITKTLKKPSKVVENWVDALFLQQIDYKAPVKEVEQTSVVDFNENKIFEEIPQDNNSVNSQGQILQETQSFQQDENPQIKQKFTGYVPSDKTLKRMFINAKKYSEINQKEKALVTFDNALKYAENINDEQTCALIHFEQGKIYDSFNSVENALYNYYEAANQSSDNNVKAKAHLSMGKIYDDYVKFEPAVEHYCAAVSFAGESDNLNLQTKVLSDLAQIHAQKYDKNNALMFMDLSDVVAEETKDNQVKGLISAKNANNCKKLNENAKALQYYGKSAKAFSETDNYENLAKNYMNAAQIMLGYGNKSKAKNLLSKAFSAAQHTNAKDLKQEIANQFAGL